MCLLLRLLLHSSLRLMTTATTLGFTAICAARRLHLSNCVVYFAVSCETLQKYSFERAVACTLFHLGSSGGFRETAQAFGVSKSWCMASVNEIVRELTAMRAKCIKLPQTRRVAHCGRRLSSRSRFPSLLWGNGRNINRHQPPSRF